MKQYAYDLTSITQRINSLTDEQRKEYPAQYYDPIRIHIAHDLAMKEYYKLFPFMSELEFEKLGRAMLDWFIGKGQDVAPVHDYWNIVGSFTETFKLKELVFYLTSSNVSWKLEEMDPKLLELRWGVGDLEQNEVKTSSWTYADVKVAILDNPERLERNRQISENHSNNSVLNRDHFPIVVLRSLEGTYILLDGNRRTMKAWLSGDDAIQAWVGTAMEAPVLKDFWVSPSFLRRLLAEYTVNPSEAVLTSIHSQLDILFRQSVVAKHHYMKRCLHIPGAKEAAAELIDTPL